MALIPVENMDMDHAPMPLDAVELVSPHGGWPAGTLGTVVDELGDGVVLVEFVGPDGSTLGLVDVPGEAVRVVAPGRPLVPSGH